MNQSQILGHFQYFKENDLFNYIKKNLGILIGFLLLLITLSFNLKNTLIRRVFNKTRYLDIKSCA